MPWHYATLPIILFTIRTTFPTAITLTCFVIQNGLGEPAVGSLDPALRSFAGVIVGYMNAAPHPMVVGTGNSTVAMIDRINRIHES